MHGLNLWAQPWWVNLLLLVPALSYLYWRRTGLLLNRRTLLLLLLFAVSFGFVEAVVVVYLRGAALAGLAPTNGTAAPLQDSPSTYQQAVWFLAQIPDRLRTIEVCREAATMLMLASVALLAAPGAKERWAAFLWIFAGWDITYYLGLWTTLRWPASLYDYDVLFLIPVPWFAQVWFPGVVSAAAMLAVALAIRSSPAE